MEANFMELGFYCTQYRNLELLMQVSRMFYLNFAGIMLSQEEKNFVEYWKNNRLRRKRFIQQLGLGLPLGVGFVILIFINFFSGWYKRAGMMLNADPSLFLVLLIAGILIVVFVAVFSARHKWEMNEQRYKELMAKKDSD